MASEDSLLCPFRQWAKIVKYIWGYKGASEETPVSAVWHVDKIDRITSKEMVNALRAAVFALGEDKLGLKIKDIGTHSIRSGAVMAMYLGECPVYVIMMIGCWSSNALLRMLQFETHRHISDPVPTISRLDPRQRNHLDNEETRRNVGGNLTQQVCLPAFALFN
eukprot:4223423-Ditylum_brightwellii.AAC.1